MDVLCFEGDEKYRSQISRKLNEMNVEHECYPLYSLSGVKKIIENKNPVVILIEYRNEYKEIFGRDYFAIPLIRSIDARKENLEKRGIYPIILETVESGFPMRFMEILYRNENNSRVKEFLRKEHMRKNIIYRYNFSWGKTYIVDVEMKDKIYSILPEISRSIELLMAIRENPKKFENIVSRKIWVTDIVGENRIKPHNLTILMDNLISFLEESDKRIVFIDCIEYLLLYNDFINIMRNIELLNSYAMERNSMGIILIDKGAYTKKEYSLLRRYAIEWKGV